MSGWIVVGITGPCLYWHPWGPQEGGCFRNTSILVMSLTIFIACIYVCACLWAYPWLTVYTRSKGHPLEASSPPLTVDPGNQTLVIRPSGKHLPLLPLALVIAFPFIIIDIPLKLMSGAKVSQKRSKSGETTGKSREFFYFSSVWTPYIEHISFILKAAEMHTT